MIHVLKLIGTLALTASLAVVLTTSALAAPSSVGLGTATSYAVLAGTTITNTGPTKITGDIGLHPGSAVSGFSSVTYVGAIHLASGAALQAKNALVTAYNDAAGRTPATTIATELGGQVLKAGVYNSTAGTFGVTGTLTLDAEGDAGAVFIFQAASTLITAPGSSVVLTNGATACNVFWQVGSSATLETTTSFKGTIMALTSIALKTGATLQGRALARNGAVTLDTNVISSAACAPPTAPTIPNTSLGAENPLAASLSLTLSLILIGTLLVMMSTAVFGLARLGRPVGRGRR
jgi:hypothetical protein